MNLVRFTLFSLLLFFTAFNTSAQTMQPLPKTMLWRISGKGMKQPSYLFGTIHLRDKRVFNFSDSLYAAIEKTDGFAIEINPDEMSAELIKSFTAKDTSGYIKDELNKETYERIRKKLEKKFGTKVNRLTRRQAFLSRNEWMEEIQKPDDMSSFMDAYLYHIARQQGKWVGGIEDLNDQMSILNRKVNDFSIEELLFDVNLVNNVLNEMVLMYSNNDLQKIYEYVVKGDDTKKTILLNNRNFKMSVRIDSLMRFRTGVFAVGAAHLPGDSGVIKLLRSKGYKVEPVLSGTTVKPQDYQFKSSNTFWKTFTHDDSLYSVRYPSSSSPLYAAENLVKMEMCVDVPTSTFYITTGVPNYVKAAVSDKQFDQLLSGFSKQGKVTYKTKVELNGIKGMEIIVEGESFIRARAYVNDSYVFMAVMGHDTKKEAITDASAEYFFNSFKVEPKAFEKQADGFLLSDPKLAFNVLLPMKPEKPKEELSDEWITSSYSSFDGVNQVFYIVVGRSCGSGYYINGDSNYFNLLKESWAQSGYQKMKEENFMMGECAAMKYDLLQKEGKETFYTRTMSVNRGNRSYLLLATTAKGNENNPAIDRFFNSFQLMPYKTSVWSKHTPADNLFTAYAPKPFIKKSFNTETDTLQKKRWVYLSYDSLTAATYELLTISFTDYYQAVSDSAIFHDALNTLKEYSDTVLERKTTTNATYKSQDVIMSIKGSSLLRRLRLVLKGDSVYAAYTYLQPSLLHHPDVDAFFNDLQLNGPSVTTTLFQKKSKLFFDDLLSGDSARFEKAADNIEEIIFDKDDLPNLKQALLKHYPFAGEIHTDIYNDIADAIHTIGDSTVLSFVDKGFFSLKVDNEGQRVAMLRLLSRIKTKESYTLFKKLILTEQPNTASTYAYEYNMLDTLALTATLFPELLRLAGDTNYCNFTATLANTLLDSNFIQLQTVKAYERDLLGLAEIINTKFKEPDADTWFYDAPLHLLARINTKQGNEQLLKIVALNKGEINMSLIPEMLKNKVPVPAEVIERTATEKKHRYGLYLQLQQRKLQTFFPAKYATQKMMAESDVYLMASDEEEYEVGEVVYLQTKKREVNGVQKIFYLFKVKIGEEWHLGISGGFSADSKKITLDKDDDVGAIYWDEVFNSKKVDEQFESFFNQ